MKRRAASWRTLLAETAAKVGSEQSARWLCETASGLAGAEFLAALDETPTVRMVAHLDAMLERYRAGEPLQYVLGRWAFRRLDLLVDRRVLIPRPETELVAEVALEICRAVRQTVDRPLVVADLGTGSGAIGLSLAAELPLSGTAVWITDVSTDALDVARANLAGIGRAGANVRIAHGSWFDALPDDCRGALDVVVANPPYVATGDDLEPIVAEWEPAIALYAADDGLSEIRTLAAGAARWLRPHGWLVLEIASTHGERVAQVLGLAGLVDVTIRPDLTGRDRIAIGRRA